MYVLIFRHHSLGSRGAMGTMLMACSKDEEAVENTQATLIITVSKVVKAALDDVDNNRHTESGCFLK